jgi:hypothetical protein
VHVLEVRSLNGVVGIEGVGDPTFTIIVSTSCYLHFVSYVDAGSLLRDWPVLEDVELLHYALGLGRRFPRRWQC